MVFCVGLCTKKYEFPSESKSEFIYALAYVAWSPLYKNNERSAKISYNIYGNTPSRTVAFEFNETIYEKQDKKQYLHFQVLFFEAQPNIIQFIYLDVSSSSKSGSIGVLSMDERPMLRYSPEQPFFMLQDVSITFDTNNNTYTAVHFCGSKTCTLNEACIQEMCVERGNLSFAARWSHRNGRGHLIIRTPLNNTIYYGKPRTNSSFDEGRHELVDDGNQVDHIYWPLNSIPPIGSYKVCFSTGSLLNGTDQSSITVTIEIRHIGQPIETMIHTFNKSTTTLNECLERSDTFIGLYSIGMFSLNVKFVTNEHINIEI
ncbi:unnamed protein product [Rotaria sp. Silwood2]|nr:unnamed protein product [Rotaria sp. Silwood2]